MGPSLQTAVLGLPPEPESAGRARRFLRDRLDDIGHDDLVDAATLLVSEIVTNVVLHAPTWLEVRVRATTTGVRVEVLDGSSVAPTQRGYDEVTSTGHGLSLVAYLAADYGVELRRDGKSVWFTLNADSVRTDAERDSSAGEWPAPLHRTGRAGPTTRVVLRDLPVRLWRAARQHHEALVRELYLHQSLRNQGALHDDDRSTAGLSRVQAREAATVLDGALDAALAGAGDGASRVDLELDATAELVAGLLVLQASLDEAERLAHEGSLLVLPGLPEIVTVREWCCDQVVAQVNGVAPTAWSPTSGAVVAATRGSVQGWDASVVHGATRPVVAGDDTNRILAVSAAAAVLLGWAAEDLVGRRVVDLVPHALREAHVAGFTRYLTTGEAHVLGRPVDLLVLRRDGAEIAVRFLLERAPSPAGRSVFLAWLDPQ